MSLQELSSTVKVSTLMCAISGMVVGLALLVYGVSTSFDAAVQAAGTVIVASMALLGVAAGLVTWQEERRRVRATRTRAVYTDLIRRLQTRFHGAFDLSREFELRGDLVVWASPSVVSAAREWVATFCDVTRSVPEGYDRARLSEDQMKRLRGALASLILAIRAELGAEPLSTDDIQQVLFDT